MGKWLSLIVGGVAGTIARYALTGTIHQIFGSRFPYGTLIVNLSGCFIVGFLAAISAEKLLLSYNARLLLITGFCGAFTTFSAFMLETVGLMKDGEVAGAFWNVSANVVLGFLVFRLGMYLAEMF